MNGDMTAYSALKGYHNGASLPKFAWYQGEECAGPHPMGGLKYYQVVSEEKLAKMPRTRREIQFDARTNAWLATIGMTMTSAGEIKPVKKV